MHDRESGGASDVFLSFLLGGVVGAVLGLLFAPYSGEETRRRLKKWSNVLGGRSEDLIEKIKDIAEDYFEENGPSRSRRRASHKKRKA